MISIDQSRMWRTGLQGWSDDILPYYDELAERLPAKGRFVEIGTAWGRSAVYLASRLIAIGKSDVEVWCVDPWEPGERFNDAIQSLYANTSAAELGMLRIVRAPSVRAARLFDPHSVDAVFIDGDHTEGAVIEDITTWAIKLRGPKIMSGHDYNVDEFPGVVAAVKACFGDRIKIHVRTVWEAMP